MLQKIRLYFLFQSKHRFLLAVINVPDKSVAFKRMKNKEKPLKNHNIYSVIFQINKHICANQGNTVTLNEREYTISVLREFNDPYLV